MTSELIIRNAKVSELQNAPNRDELLREYSEYAIEGLPNPFTDLESYKGMEAAGYFQAIAAFLDGVMIGFITIVSPVSNHYGAKISVAESVFVLKEHRGTMAGRTS